MSCYGLAIPYDKTCGSMVRSRHYLAYAIVCWYGPHDRVLLLLVTCGYYPDASEWTYLRKNESMHTVSIVIVAVPQRSCDTTRPAEY